MHTASIHYISLSSVGGRKFRFVFEIDEFSISMNKCGKRDAITAHSKIDHLFIEQLYAYNMKSTDWSETRNTHKSILSLVAVTFD